MSHEYTRNAPLLRVENLCVSYDRPILHNVNFEIRNVVRPDVQQGQVVCIIGRSGIGKSQLFRCLAGLQQPSSGTVLIGTDLHPVQAGEVGVVPQNYVLLRHRTIEQNLMLAVRSFSPVWNTSGKVKVAQEDQRLRSYAEDFDLSDHLKKYPHELSGGQRQRVSILQQLLAGNRTILLDEPFSGLDVVMVEKVLALLRKVSLMDELQNLVIVSHDIESAMAISDTALVLGQSRVQVTPDPSSVAVIPGATIVMEMDLAARGLAFREDIREVPEFRDAVKEVKAAI